VESCGGQGLDCTALGIPEDAHATCDGFVCGWACDLGFVPDDDDGCEPERPDRCGVDLLDCPAGPEDSLRTCEEGQCGFVCDAERGYRLVQGGCVAEPVDLHGCLQQTTRVQATRYVWLCMSNNREEVGNQFCGDLEGRFLVDEDQPRLVRDVVLGGTWVLTDARARHHQAAIERCLDLGDEARAPTALELASLISSRRYDAQGPNDMGGVWMSPEFAGWMLERAREVGERHLWSGESLAVVPEDACGEPTPNPNDAWALAVRDINGFLFPTPSHQGLPTHYPVACFRPTF